MDEREVVQQSIRYKFIYSMTGLVLGLLCMIGGIVLFLYGVSGASSWSARILGSESNLTDAAPGALLFLVGLFGVIATRYKSTIDIDSHGAGKKRERYRHMIDF